MAAVKVRLYKKVSTSKQQYYPETSADIVNYEFGGTTITAKDVLDSVVDSIEQIENRLQGRSVYMKDSSGNIITDTAGTGCVELL